MIESKQVDLQKQKKNIKETQQALEVLSKELDGFKRKFTSKEITRETFEKHSKDIKLKSEKLTRAERELSSSMEATKKELELLQTKIKTNKSQPTPPQADDEDFLDDPVVKHETKEFKDIELF
jgi:chromosome segregation ATPase